MHSSVSDCAPDSIPEGNKVLQPSVPLYLEHQRLSCWSGLDKNVQPADRFYRGPVHRVDDITRAKRTGTGSDPTGLAVPGHAIAAHHDSTTAGLTFSASASTAALRSDIRFIAPLGTSWERNKRDKQG
jgi:hypothetical protein